MMAFVRTLAGLFFLLATQYAEAKVYVLTVGIDKYAHIPLLEGAVNDSNDIAETLSTVQGAHVVQFVNQQATKENITSAWTDLTRKAGPGDHLVLHVAGHGAVQPAIFPDAGEAFDNMYLLAGFDLEGKGTKERILDNEFAFLFQMEKEATVLFIADTCFSGTLARSADFGSDLKVRRLPSLIKFEDDQLRDELIALGPPPPATSNPNLLEIYAGGSGKTIPELPIKNQMRGALSYSVARAFDGGADRSNDQVISVKELRRFVRRKVREHANGLQHPETNVSQGLSLAFPTSPEVANVPAFDKLNLFVAISAGATIDRETVVGRLNHEEIEFAEKPSSADLILELGSDAYRFFNSTRDLIYSSTSSVNCDDQNRDDCATALLESLEGEFYPVLTKEIFLRRLSERPLLEDVEVWTRDPVTQYAEGARIGILLKTETSKNVFLFALDKYGKITALVDRPISIKSSQPKFIGESTAEPPFGADHLFAVTSSSELDEFARWLKENNERSLNQAPRFRSSYRSIGSELLAKLTQGTLSVGTLPIFTIARSE